ncbi:MAG: tetraacyldisaccharide 4'-kinase [Holophagales bacterium]|nr:tetraacyldisaccharide 4'-kinase [Holophagales bacterium]
MSPVDLAAPTASRSPWQRLYAAAHARRRRRAAASAKRLPRPVVSVGNLHWGGGGKTPMVVALARHLAEKGARVAVLSRGYRRTSRGPQVVSRGDGPCLPVAAAGDEPYLMARELPGVAVVVGERRAEAGRLALSDLDPAPDLFLLDDGFSHVALARDLDLRLGPAAPPLGGARLWPAGRLREPLASARHADAAVLTGLPAPDPVAGAALARALAPHGFAGEGFAATVRHESARTPDGEAMPAGAPVVAVAGIARAGSFFDAAERLGHVLRARLAFSDHHAYPEASLRAIARAVRAGLAVGVLTTGKDLPKLAGRLSCPVYELPFAAEPEEALFDWLDRRVAALGGAR